MLRDALDNKSFYRDGRLTWLICTDHNKCHIMIIIVFSLSCGWKWKMRCTNDPSRCSWIISQLLCLSKITAVWFFFFFFFTILYVPNVIFFWTGETREEEREKKESSPPVKRPSSRCEEMENSISTKRPRIHQQNENQQVSSRHLIIQVCTCDYKM